MPIELKLPTTKAEIIAQVEEEHAALVSLVDSFGEAERTTPLSGHWSLKDILAHITYWEDYLLLRLRSAAMGDPIPPRVVNDGDIERVNAEAYTAHQLEDWHGVRYEFDRTFQEIAAELRNLPEEGLLDPARGFEIVGLENEPAMNVIFGNTSEHYLDHAEAIRSARGAHTSSS